MILLFLSKPEGIPLAKKNLNSFILKSEFIYIDIDKPNLTKWMSKIEIVLLNY